MSEATIYCPSCKLDELYPTHGCERVQKDLADLRRSREQRERFGWDRRPCLTEEGRTHPIFAAVDAACCGVGVTKDAAG